MKLNRSRTRIDHSLETFLKFCPPGCDLIGPKGGEEFSAD